MGRTRHLQRPPSEWPVNQYVLTHPQRLLVEGIPRYTHNALVASNRLGKTEALWWVIVMAALGRYSCRHCGSTGMRDCIGCHGTSWAPEGSDYCIVAISKKQGRGAAKKKVQLFIKSLPYPSVVRTLSHEGGVLDVAEFGNNSNIYLRTEGEGWIAQQGAEYVAVGWDEEPDEEIHHEMTFRQDAGVLTRHIYALTPTQGLTWFHTRFVESKDPDVHIIHAAIFENGVAPCLTCGKTREQWDRDLTNMNYPMLTRGYPPCAKFCKRCRTYGVEPRYTAAQIHAMEREALRFGEAERMARIYGHYGDLGGNTVFDHEQKDALKAAVQSPDTTYGGRLAFQPPHPKHRYTLGCDTGEGIGKDESVVTAVDEVTGEQVCLWGSNEVPWTAVVPEVVEMASLYNEAYTVVEWRSTGMAVAQKCYEEGVRMYFHRSPNNRKSRRNAHRLGYMTSSSNRDLLLRTMIGAIVETFVRMPDGRLVVQSGKAGGLYPRDAETVRQLCRLAWHEKDNSIRVPKGKKDDRAFALAFAHEGRQTKATGLYDHEEPQHDKMRDLERQVIESSMTPRQLRRFGGRVFHA